jgi:hypothetical protein
MCHWNFWQLMPVTHLGYIGRLNLAMEAYYRASSFAEYADRAILEQMRFIEE